MNAERLSGLFSSGVAVAVATPDMYNAPLLGDEYVAVRTSVLHRQREFAAGRSAARLALEKLGLGALPILSGADRVPIWPQGYTGSISHCHGFCWSAVSCTSQVRSLGIDVEGDEPLSPELYPLIFDHEELINLAAQTTAKIDLHKVAFSAKEAFYKCYYPVVRRFLEFRDVSLRLYSEEDAPEGRFSVVVKSPNSVNANIDRNITGRWCTGGGYIFAGATLRL